MNRFTFFLWVLFLPALVNAQEDFAPVGAEWYYGIYYAVGGGTGYEQFTVEKDTLFKEIQCKKINNTQFTPYGGLNNKFSFFTYYDTGKVYYSYRDSFYLLYDFNLSVGDTFIYPVPYDYIGGSTEYFDSLCIQIIDSIQELDIDGTILKRFWLSLPINNNYLHYFDCYTEKIGGCDYFFPYFLDAAFPRDFRCYSDNEIQIKKIDNIQCDILYPPDALNPHYTNNLNIWFSDNTLYVQINDANNSINNISLYSVEGKLLYQGELILSERITGITLWDTIKKGIYYIYIKQENLNFSTYKLFIE